MLIRPKDLQPGMVVRDQRSNSETPFLDHFVKSITTSSGGIMYVTVIRPFIDSAGRLKEELYTWQFITNPGAWHPSPAIKERTVLVLEDAQVFCPKCSHLRVSPDHLRYSVTTNEVLLRHCPECRTTSLRDQWTKEPTNA